MEDDEKKKVGRLGAERYKAFEAERGGTGSPGPPKPPRARNKAFEDYGRLNIFKEPVQLIEADETKHLNFNEKAISDLMKIKHPVNVVSVVGKYRTGKSLLLNRLAGVKKAFAVGSSHIAMTKGIWIYCLPHPTHESQVLVLLDTEGLDDAMKNIKTTINVLESEQGNDSFFDVFFPVFVIAVRDNHLDTTDENKKPISPDQFLEKTLVLQRGITDSIRKFNEPRILVRRYFKERKCFMFSPPQYPKLLDEGNKQQNKDFEQDVELFLNYIYECKPKRMASGKVLTGRMFGSLVRSYTRFIQEEKTPCLHDAAKEMIDFENQNSLHAAENLYKKEMQKMIGANMPSSEMMMKLHDQCMKKAIEYLRRMIIYHDIQLFLDTAKDSFIEILKKLERSIAKDSHNICWQRLEFLDNQRIVKKIKNQAYKHVAGYDEYIEDIKWVAKQYNETTGLGPKMRIALQEYLDGKEKEEEAIYQMVLKVQEDAGKGSARKNVEPKTRSMATQMSKKDKSQTKSGSVVSDDLLSMIMEDQQLQKKDMTENFFTFMKLKIAEYERQLGEGEESSAAATKEENDRFRATFLKDMTEEEIGPRPAPFGEEKPYPPPKPSKCKIL